MLHICYITKTFIYLINFINAMDNKIKLSKIEKEIMDEMSKGISFSELFYRLRNKNRKLSLKKLRTIINGLIKKGIIKDIRNEKRK